MNMIIALLCFGSIAGFGGGLIGLIIRKLLKGDTKPPKVLMLLSAVIFVATMTVGVATSDTEEEPLEEATVIAEEVEEPEPEEKRENKMSDEEMERVQAIFKEHVGKELEYKPKYCGEWRNGDQYVTENFAYGQYLINMDVKGNVHLVVWIQDKKGERNRTVVYNRLEDDVIAETPDDGAIHLIDGQEGEYGTTVNGFIHYKVPAGDYTVVNEGKRAVVFVIADNDPNDERYYIPMTEGESAEITVDEDAHIELSAASMIALK